MEPTCREENVSLVATEAPRPSSSIQCVRRWFVTIVTSGFLVALVLSIAMLVLALPRPVSRSSHSVPEKATKRHLEKDPFPRLGSALPYWKDSPHAQGERDEKALGEGPTKRHLENATKRNLEKDPTPGPHAQALHSSDQFMTVANGDGTVSLKTIWGKYVTAQGDGTLVADESNMTSAWEHFEQIEGPNGTKAFKSHHGKYVTVQSDGSLAATRDNHTDSEFFLAVNNGDSTASFFTWNRRFVTNDTNSTPSTEKLRMLSCSQGVSLRCMNGSFLAAHQEDQSITADSPEASAGCFSLNVHGDGKISLKTYFGKYVTAQANGTLTADSDVAEAWQQFQRVGMSDGTFSLLTAHGDYVDVATVNAKAAPTPLDLVPLKHRQPSSENETHSAPTKHHRKSSENKTDLSPVNHSQPSHENETLPSAHTEPRGPTLFCFSYAMTSGYEWDTLCLQRQYNFSIFSCDDWAVYSLEPAHITVQDETIAIYGAPAPVGSQPGGALILNTDLFLRVWNKIREGGQFRNNQWTVKADVDAVFFPDRLRTHLTWNNNQWRNKVYYKNCENFHSMQGPLEVYSQAAISAFFEGMSTCTQQVHGNFGEDIFMQHCLPILGISFLEDYNMVADQYCGTLPYTCACDGPNTWRAALHPCKSSDTWLNCHKISTDLVAANEKSKTK